MPDFEKPSGSEEKKQKPANKIEEEKLVHIPTPEEVRLYGEKSAAEIKDEGRRRRRRMVVLSKEFAKRQERFPFPGINPDGYLKLKDSEEEFPGFATPIDELIQRFKNEGMKVVSGNDPESGNIYILPFRINDIENDGIFPKYLEIGGIMDEKLKELVLVSRS